MLSISKLFIAALAVTATKACVDETYDKDNCDGEVVTADGNGTPVSPDIVTRVKDCFFAKFGEGPWVVDGVSLPDFGGLGNAWGVRLTDEAGDTYQMTLANNCGCKNTMNNNIVDTIFDEAGKGEHLTIKNTCGVENCGGSELPSGMWFAIQRCSLPNSGGCGANGYQRWEEC